MTTRPRGVCDFNPPSHAKECARNDDDRIDGFNNISIHIYIISYALTDSGGGPYRDYSRG